MVLEFKVKFGKIITLTFIFDLKILANMIFAELSQFSSECPKIRQYLTHKLCQKFGLIWLKNKQDYLNIKVSTPDEFIEIMLNFESRINKAESTCDLCFSSISVK